MTKNYKEFELNKENLKKEIIKELDNINNKTLDIIDNSYDIDKIEAILCELKLLRIKSLGR